MIESCSPKVVVDSTIDAAYDAPFKEEPDMVAVYILLGCLTVSGVVIVSLFVYCLAQCWRQRCAGRSLTRTNSRPHSFTSRVPTIKISGASTSQNSVDGYLTMAHCPAHGSGFSGEHFISKILKYMAFMVFWERHPTTNLA
uniref:Uncharacterized protein n=1 Tax=Plectus sambesii TaxID=2011161 RepID=A0A914V149_9BILA